MQVRHKDRKRYFEEQAATSKEYYLEYVERFHKVEEGLRVLEIGCGEGGNLLPFAERGCHVEGIDLSQTRIEQAETFFEEQDYECRFVCGNFCEMTPPEAKRKYDVILIHDVIEHIPQKLKLCFLQNVRGFLAPSGIAFFGFPAWQMPFGGHQQICHSRISKCPWIHLLPKKIYERLLKRCGEGEDNVRELLSIREAATPIERFEELCRTAQLSVVLRHLWLINPHYRMKFGLTPRRVPPFLDRLPMLRNFYTTACFYILMAG